MEWESIVMKWKGRNWNEEKEKESCTNRKEESAMKWKKKRIKIGKKKVEWSKRIVQK